MRKRPLCFICITLVMMMWILYASGGLDRPSDVSFLAESSVTIIGKIYQCEYDNNNQVLYLKQTSLFVNSQNEKLNIETNKAGNIKVTCPIEPEVFMVDDVLCLTGYLQEPEGASNPGQFDMAHYYRSKKIAFTMWEPDVQLLERPKISVMRGLWSVRQYMAASLDEILPNQHGAVIKGMTLGDKSSISEETKQSYQSAGISHLLAISGLHLQMLGNGLYKILRKSRMGLYAAASVSTIFLIGYGFLTGNSVATVRALIMFLLGVGADVTGRTYDGITGVSLTALVVIAGNPAFLMNSGFWLSFCAVSSFLIFKEKRKILSAVIFYFFMAPITLYYFYELPLYSALINLLVVPTAGVVLVSGIMGALGTMIYPLLGKIMIFPAAIVLQFYKYLCDINEKVPNHTIILGKPSFLQMILFYGMLILMLWLFRRYALYFRRIFVLLLIIPAMYILLYRGISGVQITMLDVGQGDSFVIRTETGNTYLVDGGSTSEKAIGKYRIYPYLKHEGVRSVEGIFISHADKDHINGIVELLELKKLGNINLDIEKIWIPDWEDVKMYQSLLDLTEELNIEVDKFEKGMVMTDGEMTFTCLHPDGEDYNEQLNEGSMVIRLDYRKFSMLFTGDLEGNVEKDIAKRCGDIDILKAGHHGSDTSSSAEFLEELRPQIALISCGKNNAYGHPHKEVLGRFNSYQTDVFRSDWYGAVTLRTDGEKIDLKTYKQYNEG